MGTAVPNQGRTFEFVVVLLGAYLFETVMSSSWLLDHYIVPLLIPDCIAWIGVHFCLKLTKLLQLSFMFPSFSFPVCLL